MYTFFLFSESIWLRVFYHSNRNESKTTALTASAWLWNHHHHPHPSNGSLHPHPNSWQSSPPPPTHPHFLSQSIQLLEEVDYCSFGDWGLHYVFKVLLCHWMLQESIHCKDTDYSVCIPHSYNGVTLSLVLLCPLPELLQWTHAHTHLLSVIWDMSRLGLVGLWCDCHFNFWGVTGLFPPQTLPFHIYNSPHTSQKLLVYGFCYLICWVLKI